VQGASKLSVAGQQPRQQQQHISQGTYYNPDSRGNQGRGNQGKGGGKGQFLSISRQGSVGRQMGGSSKGAMLAAKGTVSTVDAHYHAY
jgi:hypothetical protein